MIFAVNDIVQVRIGSYTANQQAINTLHYVVSATTGAGVTDAELATYLDTSLAAAYKAVLSAAARYRGVSVQKIFPLPKTLAAMVTASDGAGTVAGDMLPGQIAGIISAHTNLAGRWERGRVYLPFPGEADSDEAGLPTSSYLSRAGTVALKIYTQLTPTVGGNSITIDPVVWHRSTGPHTAENTFSRITGYQPRPGWGNQHRRGSFGRPNTPPF